MLKCNQYSVRGWLGGVLVPGKLPVSGHPANLIKVGHGPIVLAVGAGGSCLEIFSLVFHSLSLFSPSLGDGRI